MPLAWVWPARQEASLLVSLRDLPESCAGVWHLRVTAEVLVIRTETPCAEPVMNQLISLSVSRVFKTELSVYYYPWC